MLVPDWILPYVAPLSETMIGHISDMRNSEDFARFYALFKTHRDTAFDVLDPHIILGKHQQASLPTKWYLDIISKHSHEGLRGHQALSNWHQRNIVLYQAYGFPDLESATSVFIARLFDQKSQRDWLPSRIPSDEPRWWCWRQVSPGSPLVVTPMPLPPEFNTGILISVWRGWSLDWNRYDRGSIRWIRVKRTPASGRIWDIEPEELIAWDARAAADLADLPDPDEDQRLRDSMIQRAADGILQRLFLALLPQIKAQERRYLHATTTTRTKHLSSRC